MSRNRLSLIALIGLLAIGSLLLFAVPDAWAQRGRIGDRTGGIGQGYQYVIKFICGEVSIVDAQGDVTVDAGYGQFLAPGEYSTIINIHNPNEETAEYGVDWFKKIVTDYYIVQSDSTKLDGNERPRFVSQKPNNATNIIRWITQNTTGQIVGTTSPPREKIQDFSLGRDEASRANCWEIRQIVKQAAGSFDDDDLIKGFVVIYSKVQLDITAVYSACDRDDTDELDCEDVTGGGVSTINVQRIQSNGITPPAGIGLEAEFNNRTFPTTYENADCGPGGCQYVVKFVCGEISDAVQGDPLAGLESDLAPGEYYTEIDLHNPNPNTVDANKLFVADPQVPQVTGKLSSPDKFSLEVDEAMEIGCQDIRQRGTDAPDTPAFFKGYVVITTFSKLDIVATYTACRWNATGLGCSAADDNTAGTDDVRSLEVRQGKDLFLSDITPDAADMPGAGGASLAATTVVRSSALGLSFQLRSPGLWPMMAMNVQVYSTQGRAVFKSGWQLGDRLSWRPMSADGRPLANGVYLYVIQGKDALGRVVRTIGKFVVLR